MMNYASDHNIYPSSEVNVYAHMDTIHVDAGYNMLKLAECMEMSIDELQTLNPALKRGIIPFGVEKVTLTVPYHKAQKFASLNDTAFRKTSNEELIALNRQLAIEKKAEKLVTKKSPAKNKTNYYVVKRGDSIGKIAVKYNVSEQELKRINKIKGNRIIAGQKLKVAINKG